MPSVEQSPRGVVAVRPVAVEEVVDLDAEDDGELPAGDRLARLGRRAHDAEPSRPRAAALRVDERLERDRISELLIDRRHRIGAVDAPLVLVAEAEGLVRDGEHRDEPEPALIRALEPPVVHLLVRRRVPRGPAVEDGRPERRVRVVSRSGSYGIVDGRKMIAVEELLAAVPDPGGTARCRQLAARLGHQVAVRAVVGTKSHVDIVADGIVRRPGEDTATVPGVGEHVDVYVGVAAERAVARLRGR